MTFMKPPELSAIWRRISFCVLAGVADADGVDALVDRNIPNPRFAIFESIGEDDGRMDVEVARYWRVGVHRGRLLQPRANRCVRVFVWRAVADDLRTGIVPDRRAQRSGNSEIGQQAGILVKGHECDAIVTEELVDEGHRGKLKRLEPATVVACVREHGA